MINSPDTGASTPDQIFTIQVGDEWFGIPIGKVRSIFRTREITPIPLAPPAVAGLVNVRGEVLTAINTFICLGVQSQTEQREEILIVGVEHDNEKFGLIVSQAGEILDISSEEMITLPNSATTDQSRSNLPTYLVGDFYYPIIDIRSMLDFSASDPKAA